MGCPLCGKTRYIKLRSYEVREIVKTYQDIFSIDVASYFHEDILELHQCVECSLQYFPSGIEGKSDFYESLSKVDWYYMKDKYEYEYAIKNIIAVKPNSILEIGCGKGYFLERVKDSFFVRATEQNLEAIEGLKAKGIILDDGSTKYDFIVSFQVLEHVKNIGDFLAWLKGKMNPGGHLFLTIPNPDSVYMKEFFQITDFPPHHINRIPKETLCAIGKLLNLQVVDYFEEPINDIHLKQIIEERQKCFWNNDEPDISKQLVRSFETAILPLIREVLPFRGHTHGILLKKEV